jgi:hypothetical protein
MFPGIHAQVTEDEAEISVIPEEAEPFMSRKPM